jgi:transcriptional regulator with XRE-family HTH domain
MYKRLRALRKELRLNQSDFAAQIGMAQSGYSQIETGIYLFLSERARVCTIWRSLPFSPSRARTVS